MRALAIDVGGTHISCAAVADDAILHQAHVEVESRGRLANVLPALARQLSQMLSIEREQFAGLAFGFCGLVNTRAGKIVSTNQKYPDAIDVDLTSWAQRELGLRIMVENDARLALLGERYCGAARGSDNLVMITLGTGIGTAVVVEGKLLRGKHFQAGCLGGHFTVAPHGRRCSCGAFGCFEAESSTYALPELCRQWPGFEGSSLRNEEKLDFKRLFLWADRGDPVSIEIRAHCIDIWAACALSLVHAYDPELLVLGGGVMQASYPIAKAIENHLAAQAWTPWGKVRVLEAELGSNAALLGAVPLLESNNELELR